MRKRKGRPACRIEGTGVQGGSCSPSTASMGRQPGKWEGGDVITKSGRKREVSIPVLGPGEQRQSKVSRKPYGDTVPAWCPLFLQELCPLQARSVCLALQNMSHSLIPS